MKKLFDSITSYEEAMEVPELSKMRMSRPSDVRHFLEIGAYLYIPSSISKPISAGGGHATLSDGQHTNSINLPKHLWWFVREWQRFQHRREEYGLVMMNLWQVPHLMAYCPKPHPADRSKIEFYPDARAAIAERPVVTSMAKFLTRSIAIYSDEYIRDVDAAYRASQSNEVEFLTGVDGFRDAYINGPHSCMAYGWHEPEAYPLYEGKHPVDMYAVPGMSVAISRDGAGKINGRCVCYVNPADLTDKRMIRVYGDLALEGRLKRNGFAYKGLQGVKVKAQALSYKERDHLGQTSFSMAFLDGPNGSHHDTAEAYRHAIWFTDDPEHFTLLNPTQMKSLTAAFAKKDSILSDHINTSGSTGIVWLHATDRAITQLHCEFSGETVDLLDPKNTNVQTIMVWHEGKIKPALLRDSIRGQFTEPITVLEIASGGICKLTHVYAPFDTPAFNYDGRRWLDTDDSRTYCGYIKLDPEKYSDRPEWMTSTRRPRYRTMLPSMFEGSTAIVEEVGNGLIMIGRWAYLKTDCVAIVKKFTSDDEVLSYTASWVYKDDLDATYVRVHSMKRGEALYAAPNVKTVKTVTGRLVVPGWHAVVELWDGRWAFERTATAHYHYRALYWYLRSESEPVIGVDSPIHVKALKDIAAGLKNNARLYQYRVRDTNCNREWENTFLQAFVNYAVDTGIFRYIDRYIPSKAFLKKIKQILADETVTDVIKKKFVDAVGVYLQVRKTYMESYIAYLHDNGLLDQGNAEPPLDWTLTWTPLPAEPESAPITEEEAMAAVEARATPIALLAALTAVPFTV